MSVKSKNGDVTGILFKDADGKVSIPKVGLLVAIAAYTYFINPMFILGMFELMIIMYLLYLFWKIFGALLSPQTT
jgi:hypothetical protein